jgi:1-acyl-sn-glycerol-3-phosphate acyltransferase
MEDPIKLSFKERFSLALQRFFAWATFPCWGAIVIALIRFVGWYRIEGIRKVRRHYKQLARSSRRPIIVCANHLTKIDSAIINWSLASMWEYFRSFRLYSWNLPERARYAKNIFLRFLCYIGSCIPVDRGGDRNAVKKSLDKLIYLLQKGHTITIFPEGQRSRTGAIDAENFAYGVGRLVQKVKDCRILCVYLRGYSQKEFGGVPRIGERFYVDTSVVNARSEHTGLRAARDIATQIINELRRLEQGYFAACRQ